MVLSVGDAHLGVPYNVQHRRDGRPRPSTDDQGRSPLQDHFSVLYIVK